MLTVGINGWMKPAVWNVWEPACPWDIVPADGPTDTEFGACVPPVPALVEEPRLAPAAPPKVERGESLCGESGSDPPPFGRPLADRMPNAEISSFAMGAITSWTRPSGG